MRRKTGYVQNRGTSWRIAYYVEGIRHFESFSMEDEALRELAKRLSDAANGVPVSSKPNTVKFGELCADVVNDYRVNKHRSLDDINTRFRLHIVPVFGNRKASQITTAQLRAYILLRQGKGASTGTINRELEAIRRAFLLAIKEKKLFASPSIPMLKESNVRQGFFTREEVERLCSHLKKPLDSFVMFAFLTGWRYGEVQGLLWRNVDFQAGEIRLDPGTTKNRDARVFPLTDEIRSLLESLASTRPPNLARFGRIRKAETLRRVNVAGVTTLAVSVFTIGGRPIGAFRKSWRTACIKAGFCIRDTKGGVAAITRIFHDLRRSCVKRMVAEGIPERVIMDLCGWKTRSVLDRYHIVSNIDMENARHKMNHAAASGTK